MIALLIIHGLLAVALLGAITHQAIGVWLPARPGAESFTLPPFYPFSLVSFRKTTGYYLPPTQEFGWFVEKTKDGPAMYWYGWLATAAIGAFTVAALASWLPGAVSDRIAPLWSWLIPSLVMINFAYLLRSFFLR